MHFKGMSAPLLSWMDSANLHIVLRIAALDSVDFIPGLN